MALSTECRRRQHGRCNAPRCDCSCHDPYLTAGLPPDVPTSVCPGCKREVRLLPPRAARPGSGHLPRPWRRRAHATHGQLCSTAKTVRCRYPVELTPDEVPTPMEETPAWT